jgi:hypothetical protein
MPTPVLQCGIEAIQDWHPRLFLEPHIVACVAVLSQYSDSPAIMNVTCDDIESDRLSGETELQLELSWSSETQEKANRLRATVQSNSLLEMASCALGFLLVHQILQAGQLDVTQYGNRADYRFLDASYVLEISGTERDSEFERRHRDKASQALANPLGWDAFVIVCAFSQEGHRIRFSFHRNEEIHHESDPS